MKFTIYVYLFMLLIASLSYVKDKARTINTLKRVYQSTGNMLPQCILVLLLVMPLISILDKDLILHTMGNKSGLIGILIAGMIGSIAYIPAIIAFPLSMQLLEAGAGYGQITMLATSLTMVGVVTMPIEFKYFGKLLTLKRNVYGFIYAFVISYIFSLFLI